MPTGLYIGVNNKARKIKKMYVGSTSVSPVYTEKTITSSNIDTYFTVTMNPTYRWTVDANATYHGTYEGTLTLIPKQDCEISFDYNIFTNTSNSRYYCQIYYEGVDLTSFGDRYWQEKSSSLNFPVQKDSTLLFNLKQDPGSDTSTTVNLTVSNIKIKYQSFTTSKNNVAKEIVKGYIGVNGKARQFWPHVLTYYEYMASTGENRIYRYASGSIGDYALFAGGTDLDHFTYPTNLVKAYNSSLTLNSNISGLYQSVHSLATATLQNNYIIFAGGMPSDGDYPTKVVTIYDSSLTKLGNLYSLYQKLYAFAGSSTSEYAFFGGGCRDSSDTQFQSDVNIFDSSLTRTYIGGYTGGISPRLNLAATSINNEKVVFGGGQIGRQARRCTTGKYVEAYDNSLTKTVGTSLSVSRKFLAGASTGNYALFAGGTNYKPEKEDVHDYLDYPTETNFCDNVDAYNLSLTRINAPVLSEKKTLLAGVSINNTAIFGGGGIITDSSDLWQDGLIQKGLKSVDMYDKNLVKSRLKDLQDGKAYLGAAKAGNYILFGGGVFCNDGMMQITEEKYPMTIDVYKF